MKKLNCSIRVLSICVISLCPCPSRLLAQGTSCPALPGKGLYSVVKGTTVYYAMNLSNLPTGADGSVPQTEVQNAINAWNTANSAAGTSTMLVLAGPGDKVSVTFTSDSTTSSSSAATTANPGLISSANPATVTFHPDALFTSTTIQLFQPKQPGYNTAYTQAALHEIGHLFGIGDYNDLRAGNVPMPSTPGVSVMQGFLDVNDTGTTPPLLKPTNCDTGAAKNDSHFTNLPYRGPGGPPYRSVPPNPGPGNINDYGPNPCGGGSYFDPETNTVYGWC